MFICEPCRDKNWPTAFSFMLSRGCCEVCGEYALCFDIHHSRLPDANTGTETTTTDKPDAH